MLCLRRHSHRARWSTSSSRAAIQTLKSFGTFPDWHPMLDGLHPASSSFDSTSLTTQVYTQTATPSLQSCPRRDALSLLPSIVASSNTICRRTLPVPHQYPHPASHRCPIPHLYPIRIRICICISSLSLCSSAPSVQTSHLPCPLLLLYVYSRRLLVVSIPLSDCLIAEIEMLLP